MDINAVWLTVNRKCNFRCEWCYAKGSEYCDDDEMTLELAFELYTLGKKAGASKLIILGGEPTLWKPLPDFIKRLNSANPEMTPVIVTNGALFASVNFRKKFANLHYEVGLSLKAGNDERHRSLTKSTSFDQVRRAIGALSSENYLYGASITINNRILDDLEEMVQVVADSGGKAVSFEMCTPSFDAKGKPSGEFLVEPKTLAEKLAEVYPSLHRIMDGKVYFQVSVPFCLFPDGFIDTLMKRRQVISGCHVFNRDGIIFNPQGGVLLCNCLYHLPIGFWGKDFNNISSFTDWWQRKEVKEVNGRLLYYPVEKCKTCKWYRYCGGGCCLQWFYFNPVDVLK